MPTVRHHFTTHALHPWVYFFLFVFFPPFFFLYDKDVDRKRNGNKCLLTLTPSPYNVRSGRHSWDWTLRHAAFAGAAALFGGSLVWYTYHKQAKEIGWMQSKAFFRHGMNNIAVMALCQSAIDHVNVPLVSIWPSCDRLRELLSLSLLQRAACAAWCCRESCTLPPHMHALKSFLLN